MSEQVIGEFPFMEEALKAPLDVLELYTSQKASGHALHVKLNKQLATPSGRKAYVDALKPVLRYAGHKIKQLRGTHAFARTIHHDDGKSVVYVPSMNSVGLSEVPQVVRAPNGKITSVRINPTLNSHVIGKHPYMIPPLDNDEEDFAPGWTYNYRLPDMREHFGADDPFGVRAAVYYLSQSPASMSSWLGRGNSNWRMYHPEALHKHVMEIARLVAHAPSSRTQGLANDLFAASFEKYRRDYLKWSITSAKELHQCVYPVLDSFDGTKLRVLRNQLNNTNFDKVLVMVGRLLISYMMTTKSRYFSQSFVTQAHQLLDKDVLSFMSRYLEPMKQTVEVYNILVQLPGFKQALQEGRVGDAHGKAVGMILSVLQHAQHITRPRGRRAEDPFIDYLDEEARLAGGLDAILADQVTSTTYAMKILNQVFIANTGEGMPSSMWRFMLRQGSHTISQMLMPREVRGGTVPHHYRFLRLLAKTLPKAKVGPTLVSIMSQRYTRAIDRPGRVFDWGNGNVHEDVDPEDFPRFERMFAGFMLAAYREARKKGSMKRAWIRAQDIARWEEEQVKYDTAPRRGFRVKYPKLRVGTHTTPDHDEVMDWLKTLPNLGGNQLALPYGWWLKQAKAWHENPDNPRFLDNMMETVRHEFRRVAGRQLDQLDRQIMDLKTKHNIYPYAIERFEHKGVVARALSSDALLREEGQEMNHCVGGYGSTLWHGESRIFAFHNTVTGERATLEMVLRTNHAMRYRLHDDPDEQATFWEDRQFNGQRNAMITDPGLLEARTKLLEAYSKAQPGPHEQPNMDKVKPLIAQKRALAERAAQDLLYNLAAKLRPAQLERVKKQLDSLVKSETRYA